MKFLAPKTLIAAAVMVSVVALKISAGGGRLRRRTTPALKRLGRRVFPTLIWATVFIATRFWVPAAPTLFLRWEATIT